MRHGVPRRWLPAWVLWATVVALPACRRPPPRPAAGTPAPAPSASQGEFVLRVINNHWLDVTVYVVHDGQRTRVGTATASSRHDFPLPGRLLGVSHQIYLVGDPIGSTEVVQTERLQVEPGQFVEWTIQSNLRNSNVAVY